MPIPGPKSLRNVGRPFVLTTLRQRIGRRKVITTPVNPSGKEILAVDGTPLLAVDGSSLLQQAA